MSRTLSPSSKEVPSFPSTKTSHFFSCREIENPRTGGENEHGRKIDDEARANVTRSSRFLRRSLAAQLACHKLAARTSILISKLTKLEIRGGTRQFFRNAGTRSRATGVLLFAVAGLKQRKKGNASRERRRERSMQSGPNFFSSPLSRGLIVARVVTPRKIYLS